MATKLLLLVLLGALACTSNGRRFALEKGAVDLEFWHHFPRQGGGFRFGGGSGFRTGPGGAGWIGGGGGAGGGLDGRNGGGGGGGGGQGVGTEATPLPGPSTGSSDGGREYSNRGTVSGTGGDGLP